MFMPKVLAREPIHYTTRMCFVSPLMMISGDAGGGDAGDDFHIHTHTHT